MMSEMEGIRQKEEVKSRRVVKNLMESNDFNNIIERFLY